MISRAYKTLVNTSLDVAKMVIEKQKSEIQELREENARLLCIIENLTKQKKEVRYERRFC